MSEELDLTVETKGQDLNPINLTEAQIQKLVEDGNLKVTINQEIIEFRGTAPAPGIGDPGNGGGGPGDGGETGDPGQGGGSEVVWGQGNGKKARLKLWTPYNHNGVLQMNAKNRPILLEAGNVETKEVLFIQNTDKFIVTEELLNPDDDSGYTDYWRITKFRNEDQLAGDYLREPPKVPYANIKPIFYVPKDLVEILK